MLNFKNHIFDLDGTVADSMGDWAKTMKQILDERSISYPEDLIKRITPLGDRGIARYYKELGVKESEEQIIERMHEIALEKYRFTIPPKEGVCDYIKRLGAKGCRIFMLTASPHILVDPCLERFGIKELFDGIYSCDDFKRYKSDAAIYRMLCEKEGIELCDTVFYDDNVIAVKMAAEAGLTTVGVYDPSSEEYAEEIKQHCAKYINSFLLL